VDQLIDEAADEAEKAHAVKCNVSAQRPPGESQSVCADQWTSANNKHHVEDGRTDDRSNADVAVSDEYADDAGEEFRGTAAGRHQRRAGHVLRDTQSDRDHLQRRDEVLIADDCQSNKHVDRADGV